MPEEYLARCQNQSLSGEVHRHIGWLHRDVDGFEMRPHYGRWIGQSAGGKGVTGKQKTEVIRNEWLRDWAYRKKSQAQQQGNNADGGNREAASMG